MVQSSDLSLSPLLHLVRNRSATATVATSGRMMFAATAPRANGVSFNISTEGLFHVNVPGGNEELKIQPRATKRRATP